MGNKYSNQDTYKICLRCNNNGNLNDKLMILNIFIEEHIKYTNGESGKRLLLRCSNGHLISYSGSSKHIDCYVNEINNKINNSSKIDDLKKEITELKKEIEELKKKNNNLINDPLVEPNDQIEEINLIEFK